MEVLNNRVTLLSNYEVLQVLNEVKKTEAQKSKGKRSKVLSTIAYEATKYLKTTPAVRQSAAQIGSLIKNVDKFKFTAAETMQIINLVPTTGTEIQLICEESEERFSTEEVLNDIVDSNRLFSDDFTFIHE